mmetsp:Transcript_15821/g.22620  ORF Transcript_15821/g.22620 Transcript_15821/m.22620 type:complete len:99 (+) Transcript_15821:119-415(+)
MKSFIQVQLINCHSLCTNPNGKIVFFIFNQSLYPRKGQSIVMVQFLYFSLLLFLVIFFCLLWKSSRDGVYEVGELYGASISKQLLRIKSIASFENSSR